ncbi:phage tail tape measure protein [Paenilisteria newyorkensis]|uniref:phage tail tape measure protein n=1 Tax=Listeria newyorkensis TaxID=1497681 RepID=UPI0023598D4E|nr:phage tail tape measure protein [Listeria newyorkensis]WAO22032.1 phage tail tape measure protein [Listeria newyorkensis]
MSGNTPLGKMIVEMDLNASKFTSSLTAVKRSLKNSESQMKAQMAVFDNADNKLGKLEAQYNGLNRSLQINKKHVDNLTEAYKKEVEANGEASVRAQNLARDINNTVSKQANLERQLKATGAAMDVEKLDLEELNNKMQANSRHTSALAQQQSLAGNKMGALRTQYSGLGQKITDLTRIREAERQKLETIASVSGKTSSAYMNQKARIAELDNQIKINSNTMDSYAKKIGGLSPRFDEFRNQLENNASRFKNVGDKAWEAGKTVTTRFSAPLAVGLGVAIKKAADFEAQMDSVQAVSGATGSEMTKLQDLAIQLGADTKYSAKEAAMGIEELLKAGLSTSDVLNGGLAGALDLATAGEIDLASAAEIASTALNAFRDDNLSVADAANILAGGANASATDVEGLRLGLQQASAVASGAGLSFEDTATTLSVFAQNGLKGSDAGTSLKTMLMRLHPQTDKAVEEFERLGLLTTNTENAMKTLKDNGIKPLSGEQDILMEQMHDLAKSMAGPKASTAKVNKEFNKLLMNSGSLQSAFYDANGDLRSMSEISDILQKSLKGMSSEQRSAALNTMFGSDAIRAGNILYKEGAKGIKDMNKEMSKVTAAEVAKKKMDNLKGAVEELSGAAETLAISAGQTLIPMFTDVVKHAQQMLDKFNNLNPGTQKFITQMALAGAVAGPAIMAFGGLNRGLSSMLTLTSKTVTGISLLKLAMQGGSKGAQTLKTSSDLVGSSMSRVAMNSGKAGLGLLGLNPVLLGVTATLGIGFVAWKLWGEQAYESSKRTQRWGTDVGETADKSLNKFKNFSVEAKGSIETFTNGATEDAKKIKEAFQNMATEIIDNTDKSLEEFEKSYGKYSSNVQEIMKEGYEKEKETGEKRKENVTAQAAAIDKIYSDAKGRVLSSEESKMVSDIYQAMQIEEIESLNISGKKKKALIKSMNGDVTSLNKQQLTEQNDYFAKSTQAVVQKYDKMEKEVNKSYEDGVINATTRNIALSELNHERNGEAYASTKAWVQTQRKLYEENGTDVKTGEATIKKGLEDMGLSYEKYTKKALSTAETVGVANKLIADGVSKADLAWNGLILNPKTGRVRTNLPQFIKESTTSKEGWDNLRFIVKNAKLTTDAKKTISTALIQNGKWNSLNFKEQQALLTTNSQKQMHKILVDNGTWSKLTYDQKMAFLNTNSPETAYKFMKAAGLWDKLTPKQKDMIMNTNASDVASQLRAAIRDWDKIPQRDQKVLEFSYKTNGKAPSGPQGFAKGTNFHKGGPALVNDAPGSRFKELITTPNGNSFIPEGRNVLLDLPRGSSVLRGDKTAKLIPRYASGTKNAESARKKALREAEAARKKAESARKKAQRAAEVARKKEAAKPTLSKMSTAFNVAIQPNLSGIQYAGDSNKLNTQLKSMISKLAKESQNRKSKNVSNLSVNNAKRYVENEYKKLQTLIKQRDTLIQKIKSGNEKLKELQQQSNDYAKGITDSAKSYTSITSLDKDGFDTKYMQQGMTERLKNLNEFNANLEKLKKMGVNKTTLSDIMEAGVEGGASYAKALAGSDKKTIQSLNSLQVQINTASSRLGNNSANYMYKAGIDSAKGLVKGLESQQKALENASKKMANTIVNTTKKTLKIKSPSQRFRDEIGKMVPAGIIKGVEGMKSKVADTMNNLVSVPSIEIPPIREGSLLMTSIKSALNAPGGNKAVQTVDNNGVVEQLVASNKQQGEMIQLLKALLSKDLIVDDKALERSNTKIQNRQLRNDLHSLGGSI